MKAFKVHENFQSSRKLSNFMKTFKLALKVHESFQKVIKKYKAKIIELVMVLIEIFFCFRHSFSRIFVFFYIKFQFKVLKSL